MNILVLCITPLFFYHCFHPSRHAFNQVLTHIWLYVTPHLCHSLLNSIFWCSILTHLWFAGLRSRNYGSQSRRVILIILFLSIQFLAFLEVCLGSLSYWIMPSSSQTSDSSKLGGQWSFKMLTDLLAYILHSSFSSFSAIPAHTPLYHTVHRRKWLAFALKHKEWTVEDWKRVMWSDETKINRIGSDGKQWVWKQVGEVLIDGHPGNSGILVVGFSWYGGPWAGMAQRNLQRMRGGCMPTSQWAFLMTTDLLVWRNPRFVRRKALFSKTMTPSTPLERPKTGWKGTVWPVWLFLTCFHSSWTSVLQITHVSV